jgi:2-polyprenyl-6-methoxyphenol hydroxylase-like FAD-dependent oxidoreductase
MAETRALIIGGSIAGLLTAQALSNQFGEILVVDRDHMPAEAEPRNGVPQGRHVHLLLSKGLNVMEQLLPSLSADLIEAGALPLRWGKDTATLTKGGWLRGAPTDIESVTCSRALLETTIRRRVLTNDNVRLTEGTQVDDLLLEGETVVGAVLKQRVGDHEPEEIRADLVVDASGRNSKGIEWLAAHGFPTPAETVVDAFAGYATRLYRKPADFAESWRVLYMPAPAPITRGGGAFEVENGIWIVSLGGYNKDYPPTEDQDFIEFARSLPEPDLYNAIKDAEPLTRTLSYRRTKNRMIHFERLERFPKRFVLVGDAVCGFNPIYGQGMTAAAMGAELLAECVAQGSLDDVSLTFQKKLAQQNQPIWLMATGEDFRFPGTEGDRPGFMARLFQRYLDQVITTMPHSDAVAVAFINVLNLVKSPLILFQPGVVWAVLRYRLGGKSNVSAPVSEAEKAPAV